MKMTSPCADEGTHRKETFFFRTMFSVGDIITIRRPRDGRLKSSAYVEAYDSSRELVRILLPSGERRCVNRKWCTTSVSGRNHLPPDVMRKISSYLSAKRTCRASTVCSSWHLCFGERDGVWRERLWLRWPSPGDRDARTDFCLLFKRKHQAEREARILAKSRKSGFTPRICAWSTCCKLLQSRRQAFNHHRAHQGCWGSHFTREDIRWLKEELRRLKNSVERHKESNDENSSRQKIRLVEDIDNCKAIIRFVRSSLVSNVV